MREIYVYTFVSYIIGKNFNIISLHSFKLYGKG